MLREDLALLGMSERSSPAAFDVLAEALVREQGIRDILVVVLPVDRAMIHLDMIFTMVDREHCVVFPPSFTGPTRCPVLHYRAGGSGMREKASLFEALREVGLPLEPVYCGGGDRIFQEREQWSSGCNFVAVRPGVVLGYSRNERTHRELEREAGYRIVPAPDLLDGGVEIADRHFGQAAKDIEEIKISSDKATKRARRLDNFDFEELAPDDPARVIGPTAAE